MMYYCLVSDGIVILIVEVNADFYFVKNWIRNQKCVIGQL